MTYEQLRQQKKNEALNKLTKIYNPEFNFPYDQYTSESHSEQRENEVKWIIESLQKDLEEIKNNKKV